VDLFGALRTGALTSGLLARFWGIILSFVKIKELGSSKSFVPEDFPQEMGGNHWPFFLLVLFLIVCMS